MLRLITYLSYVVACYSFVSQMKSHRFISSSLFMVEEDPNFEEHLPTLLKAGLQERPDYDMATELRKRYKKIEQTKRSAAEQLKTVNAELAIELEEIADELQESHEKFVNAAIAWDAWNRPSPDLPSQLRKETEKEKLAASDPNYQAHLADFIKKGSEADNRSSPDLPSELRMLKYKQMASVKRIAAKELRDKNINAALAEELDDLALELEESHDHFVEVAKAMAANKVNHEDDYPDSNQ